MSLDGPVAVADDKADDESCPAVDTVGNNDGRLDPGERITCTASDRVTQGDLDAGSVTNTARAQVGGTESNEDEVTVPAGQAPGLALAKVAELDMTQAGPDDRVDAGDVIRYTLTATNTGKRDASERRDLRSVATVAHVRAGAAGGPRAGGRAAVHRHAHPDSRRRQRGQGRQHGDRRGDRSRPT